MNRNPIEELKMGAFEPSAFRAMVTAYEQACKRAYPGDDETTRLRLAHAIIAFAHQGVTDSSQLRDQALAQI
ncbi:hypothetical protein FHS85_000702 [Rhodoligotrophos appendicifer]|uniref:hypothetical protein n=1 Tax=Rhodoligotrophos appendicifer TaxID=987056 RepID=UPI00117C9B0E|nr:hypothetical protein [Rhodoligotrophos appendicifer]